MRTTTIFVSLVLLGLAAAAPTASAAQIGEPTIYAGPCSQSGTSLLDRTLDTAYGIKCDVVDLGQDVVVYAVFVTNTVVDAALQTVAPVVAAFFVICYATIGNMCYIVNNLSSLTDATFQPPDVYMPSLGAISA